MWAPVCIPGGGECHILHKNHTVVCGQAALRWTLLDIEPAEDVDDAHNHVVDDLLPLGHTEVCLTLDDPEGHGTPVSHDKDAKVELED